MKWILHIIKLNMNIDVIHTHINGIILFRCSIEFEFSFRTLTNFVFFLCFLQSMSSISRTTKKAFYMCWSMVSCLVNAISAETKCTGAAPKNGKPSNDSSLRICMCCNLYIFIRICCFVSDAVPNYVQIQLIMISHSSI